MGLSFHESKGIKMIDTKPDDSCLNPHDGRRKPTPTRKRKLEAIFELIQIKKGWWEGLLYLKIWLSFYLIMCLCVSAGPKEVVRGQQIPLELEL